MRLVVALTLIAACDVENPPEFTYVLQLVRAEPLDRAVIDPAPVFLIDGVETLRLELKDDTVAALTQPHRLELRHGDRLLTSLDVAAGEGSCLDHVRDPSRYEATFCGYESGDFRFGSEAAYDRSGGACTGDGFCLPPCFPGDATCTGGSRCTSRVTSLDPVASHLGCAPTGAAQLGEACTWIDDPSGAYDDCGAGLLCVAGSCRQACRPGPGACAGCAFEPGHAPEIGLCP